MRGVRAVVWGDFVLDEYWRCLTRRVSREAPVLVLDWQSRTAEGGGAANAALNLASLGARVRAVGWVGADEAGAELRRLLQGAGVDVAGLLGHPQGPPPGKIPVGAGSVPPPPHQGGGGGRGARGPAAPRGGPAAPSHHPRSRRPDPVGARPRDEPRGLRRRGGGGRDRGG